MLAPRWCKKFLAPLTSFSRKLHPPPATKVAWRYFSRPCAKPDFRDRPGVYTHTKNALSEGATVNQMLEVFDVARFPGGGPTRMVGLNVLKRIVDEEGLTGPTDRPEKVEELAPASETRTEKVRRITARINSDLGYEDEALAKIRSAAQPVFDRWFKEMKKSGIDGPALLKDAWPADPAGQAPY